MQQLRADVEALQAVRFSAMRWARARADVS
jgi:hypothetical protein